MSVRCTDGINDPLRSLGIFSSTSPARVASSRCSCPLRPITRVSLSS